MATLECPELGVAACSNCGKNPVNCRGLCCLCLGRERRRALTDDCPGCGKRRALLTRGLCRSCAPKVRGDFRKHPNARTRRPGDDDALLAAGLREGFEKTVLPVIVGHVRRKLYDHRRHLLDDVVQEVAALAWRNMLRVAASGRRVSSLSGWFAHIAFRQWAAGHRICGKERHDDLLSDRTGVAGKGVVMSLDIGDGFSAAEFVRDVRYGTVPDRVILHLDLPCWLASLGSMTRRLVALLADGHSAKEAAEVLGVARFKVDRIRIRLRRSWSEFFRD